MYFSVITPEEKLLRQAAHELAQSPYGEHQWLWNFFPSSKEQARDFIYRRHEPELTPRFYVVSKRAPIAFSDAWQVQSRHYDPQLLEGQRLSFQLCANPVVTKKNEAGKSQRHDVIMEAKRRLLGERGLTVDAKWRQFPDKENKPSLYDVAQKSGVEWLQARGNCHGFQVIEASVDAYQKLRAGKREIRFSTVDFSGELLVSDPEAFRQALFSGIGHAKAFGCGLLVVKRAERT